MYALARRPRPAAIKLVSAPFTAVTGRDRRLALGWRAGLWISFDPVTPEESPEIEAVWDDDALVTWDDGAVLVYA